MSRPDSNLAARGSALNLVGTAVGALANFAMLALVGNHFGSDAFGVFSGATAAFLLAAVILRLGGDIGATWFVAQLVAEGRVRSTRRALRRALGPVLVVSVAATLIILAVASPLAGALTDEAGEPVYARLLRVFAVTIPVATVGETLMGATRGLGTMRPTVFSSQIGRQVGQLVTVGAALALDSNLTGVGVAWALPYLVTVAYPAWWLHRTLPRHGQLDVTEPERYWRYTIPQAANAAAQSGLEKFDIIALGFLATSTAQGEYSVANRMAHVVVLGWFAINQAQGPVYARLYAEGRNREVGEVVRTVSAWAAVVVAPILWLFVCYAEVVTRLFGPEFEAGGPALRILALALLAALWMGPAEGLLLMSGGSSTAFRNNLGALTVNVGLNLILVPEFGIRGAAFAWMISLLTSRCLATAQVARRRGTYALGRPLFEAWTGAALCFGGVGLLVRVVVGTDVRGLLVTTVIGAVTFAVVVIVRRGPMGMSELFAAMAPSGPVRLAAGDDDLSTGPHLRLGLRSSVVVSSNSDLATRRVAVGALQAGGWKGRAVRGTIGRLFPVLPTPAAAALPFVSRQEGAALPVPTDVASAAVTDAVARLGPVDEIDSVVWMLPPASDGARLSALLAADGEAVAHLRISSELAPVRPDPVDGLGVLSGIEWPLIIGSWDLDDLTAELSTVVHMGPHSATELDADTLMALLEDLRATLVGGAPGPRWAVAMHGDLTPWNIRSDGTKVVLFDWEHRRFGPRDGDLIRYLATASDGLELFETLPPSRRVATRDALRWWGKVATARRARAEQSGSASKWKERDLANELERLHRLGQMTR